MLAYWTSCNFLYARTLVLIFSQMGAVEIVFEQYVGIQIFLTVVETDAEN